VELADSLRRWSGEGRFDPVAIGFRAVVVLAQATTIFITWSLWQVRDSPPLLPAAPIPQFDVGPWLIASLALVLVVPRWGIILHLLLLAVAMLLDQTRMQPEVISLALLMLGTLHPPAPQLIARLHLVALWFFAGFHKLVSPDYYTGTVPRFMSRFVGEADPWPVICNLLRGGVASFELSLAVLAIVSRTRRLCAVLACLLHVGILLQLIVRQQWNPAVWPWNFALALAGFALIWPWQESAIQGWRGATWPTRLAVLFILFSPIGYYFGCLDAYLAHCVYSNNTPRAVIVTSDGQHQPIYFLPTLNVPFPPTHRLFEAYFAQVGRPGDRLSISDPRWWAKLNGFARREITHNDEN